MVAECPEGATQMPNGKCAVRTPQQYSQVMIQNKKREKRKKTYDSERGIQIRGRYKIKVNSLSP